MNNSPKQHWSSDQWYQFRHGIVGPFKGTANNEPWRILPDLITDDPAWWRAHTQGWYRKHSYERQAWDLWFAGMPTGNIACAVID